MGAEGRSWGLLLMQRDDGPRLKLQVRKTSVYLKCILEFCHASFSQGKINSLNAHGIQDTIHETSQTPTEKQCVPAYKVKHFVYT